MASKRTKAARKTGKNQRKKNYEKIKKISECEICTKELKSEIFLKRHKEIIHNNEQFTCDFDGTMFAQKNSLRIHMEKRHKFEILTCNVCQKAYNSKKILKRHLQSHFEKYSCDECGSVFSHKTTFTNHITIHSKLLQYKCKYCTRMFHNTTSRNNHHQVAHKNRDELSFKCHECDIYFETKEDLRIHSFIHFNGGIKTCPYCYQIFKTTKLLNVHMQKHSTKKFECKQCLETFTFETGLRKHIRLNRCKGPLINFENDENQMSDSEIMKIAKEQYESLKKVVKTNTQVKAVETEEPEDDLYETKVDYESSEDVPIKLETTTTTAIQHKRIGRTHNTYTCDKCGESVKYRKGILEHMRTFHLKKVYSCPQCTGIFKSKKAFKYHFSLIHGGNQFIVVENYACSVCDRKFDTYSGFISHKLSHENTRSHVCPICFAAFKSIGNLRRHSTIHAEDRSFVCDLCPKCFKNQNALKIHKETVHAPMKIYVNCPHCKIILQEKNLKVHIFNQHTEEGQKKLYGCNICDKTFKNDFLLKRHLEHQHFTINRDGIVYNCVQCGLIFNRQRDLRNHSFEHYEGFVYNCMCGKKFKNKRSLAIHSATHEENTNFPCSRCDAVFKTSGGRRKHIAKNHKESAMKIEEEIITTVTDVF